MGLGINNGKALLSPSPSMPHAGALDGPELTLPPVSHLASLALFACTCRAQQRGQCLTRCHLGMPLGSGHVMDVFKEERLKTYIPLPKCLFITALLIPSRCIPKLQWSIPCVSSASAAQGYCCTNQQCHQVTGSDFAKQP